MSDLERKKKMSEALGQMIYDEHFGEKMSEGMEVPKVSADSVNYVYPQGLSDEEKKALDAYMLKRRLMKQEEK